MPPKFPLVAVDIGNSRVKIGLFDSSTGPFLSPAQVLEQPVDEFDPRSLEGWLAEVNPMKTPFDWWIASVNRPPTERLIAWLSERNIRSRPSKEGCESEPKQSSFRLLEHTDLPLVVKLSEPQRVGVDRLLGAVAANRLRGAGRPAVIIDLGSAMTVDLVDASGAFLGGAILPGIGMSARAMHSFTDRLPQIPMEELAEPPPALGNSTVSAMRSGLYWGAIGAMKELIVRLTAEIDPSGANSGKPPAMDRIDIFLTGGAAPAVAEYVHPRAQWVPHLVLGGIALAART